MMRRSAKGSSKTSGKKNDTNYCKLCKKYINGNAYSFKCHLFSHNAVKSRFTCKHCFKEFFRSDTYKRHLSKHTEIYSKMYVCDYCDRGFVDKRNLIKHLSLHDDSLHYQPKIKQFCCDACDAVYSEKRCLEQHIRRLHFNLQPNKPKFLDKPVLGTWFERVLDSKVCVQVTKLNNNVITIKKVANGKVEDDKVKKPSGPTSYFREKGKTQYSKAICDYCKKEMLKKSLRQHIKEKHLRIRKFVCETCHRSFNRHYQMVDHTCGSKRHKKRKRPVKLPSNP